MTSREGGSGTVVATVAAPLRRVRREMLGWMPEPVAASLRSTRRWAVRTTVRLRQPVPTDPFPPVPDTPVRLLVGPANFAGQGHAWARSAARVVPGVGAQAFAVGGGPYHYPSDYVVEPTTYRHPHWAHRHQRHVTRHFTHVLMEAGRPVFGLQNGSESAGDAAVLRRAGLSVGLVAHGSDVRLPSRHSQREADSPFAVEDDFTRILEKRAVRNAAVFEEFDGPVFVSTPDLLLDVPRARWLPVVVEPDRWEASAPPLQNPRPVVLHAPSHARLKGSDVIDEVLGGLHDAGTIRYLRVTGVPAEEMPDLVRGADVVVDQLRMGLYGVAACEAMAAGRVVVGYVGQHIRGHVLAATGFDVPVVEATAATFRDVVGELLAHRDDAAERADAGPAFVRAVHDGRRSAQTLRPWLLGETAG